MCIKRSVAKHVEYETDLWISVLARDQSLCQGFCTINNLLAYSSYGHRHTPHPSHHHAGRRPVGPQQVSRHAVLGGGGQKRKVDAWNPTGTGVVLCPLPNSPSTTLPPSTMPPKPRSTNAAVSTVSLNLLTANRLLMIARKAPGNAVEVDVIAQELDAVDTLCDDAFLGYGKADLLVLQPVWRRWNKRPVVTAEVKKLELGMQTDGVQRYVPGHRIPILVHRESVNVEKLQRAVGGPGDKLPMIEWSPNADMTQVYGAGGQHRFQALSNLKDRLVKGIRVSEAEVKRLKAAVDAGEATEDDVRSAQAKLTAEQIKLAGAGMWGFAIYDLGM
jgi:hypothetical protein